MSTKLPFPSDLPEWIERSIDGTITPEEWSLLNRAIETNEAACDFYVKYLTVYEGLLHQEGVLQFSDDTVQQECLIDMDCDDTNRGGAPVDLDFEPGLSQEEKRSRIEAYAQKKLKRYLEENKPVTVPEKNVQRSLGDVLRSIRETGQRIYRVGWRVSRVALYTAAFLLLFLSIGGYLYSQRTLATVIEEVHAQWDSVIPEDGRLKAQTLRLEQGYARLRMNKGTEVLLQAPSQVTLKGSNNIHMQSGCVTAKVPQEALGFTVSTPNSNVVDYGTEFGLLVDGAADAEVHVFEGRVGWGLQASPNKEPQQMLKQGQAATLSERGLSSVLNVDERAPLFTRSLALEGGVGIPGKRLSVADIIAGGNGLGLGTYGSGVHPATGMIIPKLQRGGRVDGQGYIAVPSRDFIDGVFVPDGGEGAMTVSTAGTRFSDCPDTSGKTYGGIVSRSNFSNILVNSVGQPGQLQDQIYDTPQRPSIGMHANAGITFDLENIRKTMAGVDIVRFHSLAGISSTVVHNIESNNEGGDDKIVGFWIVVDGEQRYQKQVIVQQPESFEIDVPLKPDDRFLTLMTTTPDVVSLCWAMLAETYLELTVSTQ